MLKISENIKNLESNTAISSDGVEIRYKIYGTGEPTLIFVHGWACDKSYWNEQIPYFSKSFRMVLIDLAGHGESGQNRNDWTMEFFGEDVACVAKKLGTAKIILIGHSMGGPVILEAARTMPNVIGIVGVDANFEYSEDKRTQEEKDKDQAKLDQFCSNLDQSNLIQNLSESMFIPSSDPGLVEKITKKMASRPQHIIEGAARNLNNYHSTTTRFTELQIPIRVINSFRNPIDKEAGKRYVSSFEVKLMENVGHFVMIEDPEMFNQILDNFIKDLV